MSDDDSDCSKVLYHYFFTPLESPSIYAGDGGNRKHQLLIEGGVKTLPFLTGFIQSRQWWPPPPLPDLQ